MKKFREIVESNVAPNIENLWLDKGKLKYFGPNGWELIFAGTGATTSNMLEVILTTEEFTKILNGIEVIKKFPEATSASDVVCLKVENYNYYLGRTIKTNGTASYTNSNVVNNNINSLDAVISEGIITISSNLTSIKEIIELEVGNSEEVMKINLETLKGKTLFFTTLDYGYGVGSWQPAVGGKVHVITADGIFVFYTINKNGSIIKVSEKDLDTLEGIPEGGKKGQVLTSTGTGSAEWKDNIPGEINYTGLEDIYSYGVEWDVTVADPKCTRIGNPLLHKSLPVQSQYRGCVAKGNKISYYLDPNDWTKKLNGEPAILDGTDGTVRVHISKFYGKSGKNGNKRWVRMSTVRINNTWQEIPEMLLDACKCTIDKTDPENLKAVSVMNTTTNFRGGGDRANFDDYLSSDKYRTDLGKPRTNISRANMRIYAKNAGAELLCYEFYKWVFYWAFVIEYATFNTQESVNNELTSEGYHQGGLGAGLTAMTKWNEYNNYYPIANCGCTNSLGNFSGEEIITIPQTIIDDVTIPQQNLKVNRYRGLELPFGNINLNLDGIIIERKKANEQSNVYTTDISSNYDDNEISKNKMKIAGIETPIDGFTKEFDLRDRGEIIPLLVGGSQTTYKCDYHYCNVNFTALRTLLVGGAADSGGSAGLGCFHSSYSVGNATAAVGFLTLTRV